MHAGGDGSRTATTISPDGERDERAIVVGRASVELEQRQLSLAVRERTTTVAPHTASAGARSEGWAEMQSPSSRLCLRWSPIWA